MPVLYWARARSSSRIILVCAAISFFVVGEVAAQEIKFQRKFFALPVELDMDSGAENGDASILRILPVYTFPVREDWRLVNLDILTLAKAPGGTPEFPTSDTAAENSSVGISDLVHASFYTPETSGDFIWGVGAIASIPIATEANLGSGKWAAGPAARLTYRKNLWNFGVVAGQHWSFAGNSERAEINRLLVRGSIRRQLPNDWYFVSAPIITANWDSPDEKWLIPIGGGFGRKFGAGDSPWALSVQGYYNVVKSDSAPNWIMRIALISAIPFAGD